MKQTVRRASGLTLIFSFVIAGTFVSRDTFADEFGEIAEISKKSFRLGSDYLSQGVQIRKSTTWDASSRVARLEDVIRTSNEALTGVLGAIKKSKGEEKVRVAGLNLSLAALAVRLDGLRVEVMKAPLQQCLSRRASVERPEGASKEVEAAFVPRGPWILTDCSSLSAHSRIEGKPSEKALGRIKEFCEGGNFYLGKSNVLVRAGRRLNQWDLECEKAPQIVDGHKTRTKDEYFQPHQPCAKCSKWAEKVDSDKSTPSLKSLLEASSRAVTQADHGDED